MQNLEYDDLDLVAFVNDQEYGRGKLSFMEIARSGSIAQNSKKQLM